MVLNNLVLNNMDAYVAWHPSCYFSLVMMNANRIWLEIVALVAGAACALALFIASLGAAAGAIAHPAPARASSAQPSSAQAIVPAAALPSAPAEVHEGMITDSRCGAKHSAILGKSAADCIRVCVHDGSAFALVDGETTYQLDGDLNLLKKVAGQRARITGVVHGNTITVASIAKAS